MSIQYNKEIYSNNEIALQVNFHGIKDDVATSENLKMSFSAYKKVSGEPVFAETFNYDQIVSLYQHLNKISIVTDPSKAESSKFVESSNQINSILDCFKGDNEEALEGVIKFLNNNSASAEKLEAYLGYFDDEIVEDLPAAHKCKAYKRELKNLRTLLDLEKEGGIVEKVRGLPHLINYMAWQPEAIFQKWVECNMLWIFGVEYKNHKKEARKIAIFSEADLVMESMDGFIDLIELKRPTPSILNVDASHNSYYPSVELSKAIGQCGHYMKKMDEYKLQLQNEHKVQVLRPRIKIIIGRTHEYNAEQFEALRMLNCCLNGIQVISYDYLISCGQHIVTNLENEM